jgi:type I restriction-modification system DNA methylase subunit
MMATDKDSARAAVAELVAKFDAIPKRTRDEFTEQQTRVSFILPLFSALGWDIANPAEMSAEEQISRGFVDFGFYLNGVPVFYLETKRVREDVSRPEFMQQAINYAYLKGVTWAVLTDFEDLMVFNAEWEESSPERARFLEIPYKDYATDRFDDLWYLSKASLATREIDRVAERFGKKSKREPVTTILFKQLTQWRRDLFASIQQLGDTLWANDAHEVDNAVQKLIDRLIFIRSMEDRGVEQPRLQPLMRVAKREKLWGEMQGLFRELDSAYNSNLFANSGIDMVNIYNPDLLREIIKGLYEVPGSSVARYNFNAIDADVLGAVYEQYLGFKAQDPEGKTALDPRKREKRKAQGIYYTPKFVVRYIVQQTLGKLLAEGADAHTLRILDPACGSGSFLIEAFDVLDRHLATTEPHVPDGERRQRILRENLYGVDLDDQAVEVTRLNLALRAAYDRSKLPYLTHIRHGNSLIDDTAVAGATAFRWETEFAEVFAQGGFDVVIGNPPYIRIQSLPADHVAWINDHYESAAANYDIYIPFVERGLKLLNEKGVTGYILPHKFFNAQYGTNLRRLIANGQHLREVVHFGDQQVFAGAATYTCILSLSKSPTSNFDFIKVHNLNDWQSSNDQDKGKLESELLTESEWNFELGEQGKLLSRLMKSGTNLGELVEMSVGLQTSADTVYLFEKFRVHDENTMEVFSRSLKEWVKIEKQCLKSVVRSGSISRYWALPTVLILFPYDVSSTNATLIAPENLSKRFPLAWDYLQSNRELLAGREKKSFDDTKFYRFGRSQNIGAWEQTKLLVPYMTNRLSAYFDNKENYYFVNVTTGGYGLTILPKADISYLYLCGLLNSSVLNFCLKNTSTNFRGGYFSAGKQYIENLPIRTIDPANAADVAAHDRIVALVDDMLRLKREFAAESAVLSERRHILSEQIARTDAAIDAAVYGLYGLTAEEIALVEG